MKFKEKKLKRKKDGFIALMAVLIISITLLGASFARSTNGFFSRLGTLDSEYKKVSLGLAESCVNVALLKIAQEYNYNYLLDPAYDSAKGGVVIPINPSATPRTECIIKSISFGAEDINHQKVATISTKAQYNATWSNMEVSATIQNPNFALIVRGTLTVAVNVNGGPSQSGDVTITPPPVLNPNPSTFNGSATGTTVYINLGLYNLTGAGVSTNLSGYNKSYTGCSGTITATVPKICTIKYNYIPTTGTLTLEANVINDNGGTKIPSDFPLFIDGASAASGVPVNGLSVGSHMASKNNMSGYTASSWGYHCTSGGSVSLNAGDNKTCIITFDDNAPPGPVCAETVMMLDRTGSMGSDDLADEEEAADALISLYSTVSPLPKVGVGVFGDGSDNNGFAPAQIVGQLTTVYSTLTNAINTWLDNSEGYTNLADAINKGNGELNSVRHVPGKAQVLMLVSDGQPNRPNGGTAGNTTLMFPTSNTQNGSGDSWINGIGAQVNAGTDASNNAGNRHRYSNFGLSVPTGATITGIEVKADTWSTWTGGGPSTVTLLLDGFGTGSTDSSFDESPNWTENGNAEKRAAGSGVDSPSPDGGRFAVVQNSSSICKSINASGITVLKMSYYWRGDADANDSGDDGIVEYKIGGNCGDSSGWTQLQNHDLQNDPAWSTQTQFNLPAALNNSSFLLRFRANSETNEYFRFDEVEVIGTGIPVSSGCQLGVDLSWNGGANWSNEKTQTLTGTETSYLIPSSGGSTDDWTSSHTWQPSEFTGGNFVARVRDIDPGSSCQDSATTHLDALQAKVHYSITNDPTKLALEAVDSAKLAGIRVYTIHFGSDPSGYLGKDFLANLANGTSPVTYNSVTYQNGSANDQSGTPSTVNLFVDGFGTGSTDSTFDESPTWTENGSAEKRASGSGVDSPSSDGGRFAVIQNSSSICKTINTVGATALQMSYNWRGDNDANDSGDDGIVEYKLSGNCSDSSGWTQLQNHDLQNDNSWSTRSPFALPGTLNNSSFLLRFRANSEANEYFRVDGIKITSSSIPENTDGDNFFISPNSSDMTNIFQTIGAKECPALAVTPPLPPTTANLIIITNVINDNGGILNANDFTSLLTANNPVPPGTPPGSFTGIGSPGVSITVDPGSYDVDQSAVSDYEKNLGVSCSGTLSAGATKTCTITNDDIQPSSVTPTTPPPLTNITIGSWVETP